MECLFLQNKSLGFQRRSNIVNWQSSYTKFLNYIIRRKNGNTTGFTKFKYQQNFVYGTFKFFHFLPLKVWIQKETLLFPIFISPSSIAYQNTGGNQNSFQQMDSIGHETSCPSMIHGKQQVMPLCHVQGGRMKRYFFLANYTFFCLEPYCVSGTFFAGSGFLI